MALKLTDENTEKNEFWCAVELNECGKFRLHGPFLRKEDAQIYAETDERNFQLLPLAYYEKTKFLAECSPNSGWEGIFLPKFRPKLQGDQMYCLSVIEIYD